MNKKVYGYLLIILSQRLYIKGSFYYGDTIPHGCYVYFTFWVAIRLDVGCQNDAFIRVLYFIHHEVSFGIALYRFCD